MEILRSHRDGTVVGRIGADEIGWTTPARGVRLKGDVPVTHEVLAQALILASDRDSFACDLTAAHLWSMAVPHGFGLEVDAQACAVAVLRDGSRIKARGARGRRLELPKSHLTEIRGIPITTPARTWFDCASLIKWADLVAMGDALLREGLATRKDLHSMVVWGKGRRGVRAARWALSVLDPAAESPAESRLRARFVFTGLPAPTCNPTVSVAGQIFRLDMAWLDRKVAVEYDGAEFHGPKQQAHDEWRRALLRAAGWIVIVVRKEDLQDMDAIFTEVTRCLAERRG